MFTFVPQQPVVPRRHAPGDPPIEVIDHTGGQATTNRKRTDKRHSDDVTYSHLVKQKNELLEDQVVFRKKVKDLEDERAELIRLYEEAYQENKGLKGHIQHGPDAVKIKQLKNDKQSLEQQLTALKDDNRTLTEQIKELVKVSSSARDYMNNQSWQEALVKTKRSLQRRDHRQTEESVKLERDIYDIKLDTLEKETLILLNNIKQLRKEKQNVDFAILMDKGAVSKNVIQENALKGKLEKDLQTLSSKLGEQKENSEKLRSALTQAAVAMASVKTNVKKEELSGETKVNSVKQPVVTNTETQTDNLPCDFVMKPKKKSYKSRCTQTIREHHKSTQTSDKEDSSRDTVNDKRSCVKHDFSQLAREHSPTDKIIVPTKMKSKTFLRLQYGGTLVKRNVLDKQTAHLQGSSTGTTNRNNDAVRTKDGAILVERSKHNNVVKQSKTKVRHKSKDESVVDRSKQNEVVKQSRNISKENLIVGERSKQNEILQIDKQSNVTVKHKSKDGAVVEKSKEKDVHVVEQSKPTLRQKSRTLSDFKDKLMDDAEIIQQWFGAMSSIQDGSKKYASEEDLRKVGKNPRLYTLHRNGNARRKVPSIEGDCSNVHMHVHELDRHLHGDLRYVNSQSEETLWNRESLHSTTGLSVPAGVSERYRDMISVQDSSEVDAYDQVLNEFNNKYRKPTERSKLFISDAPVVVENDQRNPKHLDQQLRHKSNISSLTAAGAEQNCYHGDSSVFRDSDMCVLDGTLEPLKFSTDGQNVTAAFVRRLIYRNPRL